MFKVRHYIKRGSILPAVFFYVTKLVIFLKKLTALYFRMKCAVVTCTTITNIVLVMHYITAT